MAYLAGSWAAMKSVMLTASHHLPRSKSQSSFGELQVPRPTPDLWTQMPKKSVFVSSLGGRCMCVVTTAVADPDPGFSPETAAAGTPSPPAAAQDHSGSPGLSSWLWRAVLLVGLGLTPGSMVIHGAQSHQNSVLTL